jgi:hypothetical protein
LDSNLAVHRGRVRHLRASFAEANERLVARLRAAEPEAAERPPASGGWSAAQVGWHVASVTSRFAAIIAGDTATAQPLPPGFRERAWAEVEAVIPERLTAPAAAVPPPVVSRAQAISGLEGSALRLARALDSLTPERGASTGISHPVTGTISLYQVAQWATAHVVRHDRQASRALGAE